MLPPIGKFGLRPGSPSCRQAKEGAGAVSFILRRSSALHAEHLAPKSEHATFKSQALHEIALLKERNLALIAANEKIAAEKFQIAAELAKMKNPKAVLKPNRIETPPGY